MAFWKKDIVNRRYRMGGSYLNKDTLEELGKLHNYYVAMMTKIDDDPSSPHRRAGEMDFSLFLKFQYLSVFSNSIFQCFSIFPVYFSIFKYAEKKKYF